MARPRRETARQEIAEEIKAVARKQMSAHGTAGLSLRAIAREMEITAPAIYNYFLRLDDLITALIIEAFQAVAEAMESADPEPPAGSRRERIIRRSLAYRQWAQEHPVEFQLIYGNPIPGYQAPAEITGPLAFRPWAGMFRLFTGAWEAGELSIPAEYQHIPAGVAKYLESWKAERGLSGPNELYYLLSAGWTRLHGIVMLELFHHLQPSVGDVEAFYQHEVEALLERCGMRGG